MQWRARVIRDDKPTISEMVKESVVSRPNIDLDVTTDCTKFQAPNCYDDDDVGELY